MNKTFVITVDFGVVGTAFYKGGKEFTFEYPDARIFLNENSSISKCKQLKLDKKVSKYSVIENYGLDIQKVVFESIYK